MGITERKERDKVEMKKMIMDAAMELFISEGYDNVSIRKIAEKIEYSPASIYNYFSDKSEIFFELHTEGFDKFYEKQISIQNINDPVERLISHGRAYVNFAIENPEYYDLMFISRDPACKIKEFETWECGDRSFKVLIKNVEDCQKAGFLVGENVESLAFVFWSLIHGVTSLYLRKRLILAHMNTEYFNELIENSLQFFRKIIK